MPTPLTPHELELMRVLRANASAPTRDGLSVPQIKWRRVDNGHQDDIPTALIGSLLLELVRRGLVRRYRSTDGNHPRLYRLTESGGQLIRMLEPAPVTPVVPVTTAAVTA